MWAEGRLALALLLGAPWLGGCYQSHQRPADAAAGRDAGARDGATRDAGPRLDGGLSRTRTVDLLFVIDNSISMEEEQANLTAEIPRLVSILTTGDFDQDGDLAGDGEPADPDFTPVSELSIAVVTSDMGSGGFSLPGCALRELGDDGVFRTRGADRPECVTAYPRFLTFRVGADPVAYSRDVSCVATVGNGGCGLEQPLEAALKALSPAAPAEWTAPGYDPPIFFRGTTGHGDGANAGFIHPGGILAVIPFTDDDDCSAADPSIFDPLDDRWMRAVNLRCTFHEEELLHPVDRYVEGLIQLRRDPSSLVFAPVAGLPLDLVPAPGQPIDWALIEGDPRLVPVIDPESPLDEVVPSCDEPGVGLAYPPNRILRAARRLEARGAGVALQSICDRDASPLLLEIIERL